MFKKFSLFAVLLAMLMLGAFSASAQEDATDEPEPTVALTVYNQGTALVRDRRSFNLNTGLNTINFTDVASSIDATSVSFLSLTDPEGTYVLEQNYVYDLVDVYALTRRFIDQVVTVTAQDGTVYMGTLLSGGDNIILQTENGQVVVLSFANLRDIQFPALPDGLITRPTLRWLVNSATTGEQEIELTYLTGGISWTADYNILLAPDNSNLDLNGWVTLSNTSGTTYRDAQVKLIAGDVNRLPTYDEFAYMDTAMEMRAVPTATPQVQQREFYEYQLYEIGRPVTVGNNETKQVEFVTSTNVPANTYYVYDASDAWYGYYAPITDTYYGFTGITDVKNYLEFSTGDENGVGADLPAGRVRVYQEDVDGAALLIGENRIDHTPKGEKVNIYLGNAFDLVGERIQTDFRLISDKVMQETYQITLRNRKDSGSVEIRVPERLFRWSNWQILSATVNGQTAEFTRLDAATIEFRVQVPAGGEVVLTYTVQYSW
ncbi:MAG: DUF4139 domain-containing protein [Phototrophicales bacterium]|nr:MAG: DUF4139 domain-containing protein [Phototrophicales bacterium]